MKLPFTLSGLLTSNSQSPFPALLRECVDSLLTVFFPTSCALCRRELAESCWTGICRECWSGIEPWTGAACSLCGLPIVSGPGPGSSEAESGPADSLLCYRCRAGEYNFDLARSYGLYRGNLRGAILEFKFHRRDRLGARLGSLLASLYGGLAAQADDGPPVIVPVPLHRSRRRERGFNQAELLARGVERAWDRTPASPGHSTQPGGHSVPRLEKACLARASATASQAGLSLRDRQTNVRHAFVVRRPTAIRDRRVILVDDVMTTGATASACAAALKKAGAGRVEVLTLARATPQFPDFGVRS